MVVEVTAARIVLASSHSSGVLGSLRGCLKWWSGGTTPAVSVVIDAVWKAVFMERRAEPRHGLIGPG